MNLKKHYFMTVSALFFLGLIVSKPGDTFTSHEAPRECRWTKGKMKCEFRNLEYQINHSVVKYHYE